ncbi:DUF881 domain-containing protein [Heliophilum fasciatum]|uniref:Uncharacterized protein YlxW (UPF0749 family) n=1 Tax=Heliophilum fasciatum TaxID=35700 RepID=A0A4V2SWR8_9FIRM|nr:DUF881 domain-containing protein [Heliophilum fasciatum]MCW2278521.1 uncharacterized protein YlxW (UPF0749 family) [Heliophilum fasciatum]TCP63476.1 uncharacterized protein YlxW (UPF0749 family) [Heliophilum fasciatum]
MMKMHMKMQWKKWQVAATIVALAMGMLLVTQFNTTIQLAKVRLEQGERQRSLQVLLQKIDADKAEMDKKVAELKSQTAKYEQMTTGQVSSGLSEELDRLRMATGYYALEGPGVQITIDDRLAPNTPVDINDLMAIVNILRYAGAEAIAVNGQRIVAHSEIYVSGKNMLINKTPISSDKDHVYVIEAIGPSQQLAQWLQVTDGLVLSMRESKIDVKITTQNKVEIPAYSGIHKFTYAKPLVPAKKRP